VDAERLARIAREHADAIEGAAATGRPPPALEFPTV
jgi:hypothetical protein